MKRAQIFKNRSVRDHQQSARVVGIAVEVAYSVGRRTVGRYFLMLADWAALEREHPNSLWWKRRFIRDLTEELDAQPGGSAQADRIRDAQVAAIDAAMGNNARQGTNT